MACFENVKESDAKILLENTLGINDYRE